jgi:hypothetical protein
MEQAKYTFGSQKGENRPREPKNGIWGLKSVWSCDISIDWKFYIEQEKVYFWGSKGKNKLSEPKKSKINFMHHIKNAP